MPGKGRGDFESMFYSVPGDTVVEVKALIDADEIVSVEQCALWAIKPAPIWVFIGEEDPSKLFNLRPGYRAFLPVVVKIDGKQEVRLWSMPLGVHRQMAEIDEAVGGIKGMIIRVKREGAGLTTRYSIVPTGRKVAVTETFPSVKEIIDILGPYDRESIIKLIEDRAKMPIAEAAKKYWQEDKAPRKRRKDAIVEDEDVDVEEV